jgi:hypothetical protein
MNNFQLEFHLHMLNGFHHLDTPTSFNSSQFQAPPPCPAACTDDWFLSASALELADALLPPREFGRREEFQRTWKAAGRPYMVWVAIDSTHIPQKMRENCMFSSVNGSWENKKNVLIIMPGTDWRETTTNHKPWWIQSRTFMKFQHLEQFSRSGWNCNLISQQVENRVNPASLHVHISTAFHTWWFYQVALW